MKIIGIAGRKAAGKNTAADLLTEKYQFKELSFAYPLKRACAEAFEMDYDTFHNHSTKEQPFKEPIVITMAHIDRLVKYLSDYGKIEPKDVVKLYHKAYSKPMFTPRNILQFVGTDMIRECVNDDFWCNALERDIIAHENVVIPDVRLPNERVFLSNMGAYLILIQRPTEEDRPDSHSSENSLGDAWEYDSVMYNTGTIEELHESMDYFYNNVICYDQKTRAQ